MKSQVLFVTCACMLASRGTASAQAQLVPPVDGIKTAEKTDVQGWNPFLGVTATVNLASNSNVVGQVDGFSTLVALGLTGGLDYVHNRHLLRSTLVITEGVARTPVIDEFVKTNDVIKLESQYNYFVTKFFGGFGRASLTSQLFATDDVRGVESTWVEKNIADPTMPIPLTANSFRQRLAGAFQPFTINESFGAFAEPIRKAKINLSFRAGLGGRHTFADSVLLADDDAATPEIELLRLTDVHQLGFEAFVGAIGKLEGGKANYRAGLSILYPFVNNDSGDRSAGALTRIGFEGQLTFNVYSWMSLVYSLNITRDPQLFPKDNELTQIQNSLLLTFQFTAVKKKEAPKEKTKEQLELEEAKQRAEEAEKKLQEAEQKLQEQQAAPPTPVPAPEAAEPPPAPAPVPVPVPTPTPTL